MNLPDPTHHYWFWPWNYQYFFEILMLLPKSITFVFFTLTNYYFVFFTFKSHIAMKSSYLVMGWRHSQTGMCLRSPLVFCFHYRSKILPFHRHPSPISTYYAVLTSRNSGIRKFLQFLVIFMWNLELCFSIIDTQVSALTEAAEFCIPVNLGVDLLPAHVYVNFHHVYYGYHHLGYFHPDYS